MLMLCFTTEIWAFYARKDKLGEEKMGERGADENLVGHSGNVR